MKLIKNKMEMEAILSSGKRLAKVFEELEFSKLISKTTYDIDMLVASLLDKYNLTSCAKGYRGYPRYSCISINNELVHGVPRNDKCIHEDDLVKIDICASYNGFCADAARPFAFFEKNELYLRMYQCGEKALSKGIDFFLEGNYVSSISGGIEDTINSYNYSVVKDFSGHGIGRKMHEDPEVPNYRRRGWKGQKLYKGMVLAIEPMFCQYSSDLCINKDDSWTAYTKDGGLAMHVEDTVILDDTRCLVATRLN